MYALGQAFISVCLRILDVEISCEGQNLKHAVLAVTMRKHVTGKDRQHLLAGKTRNADRPEHMQAWKPERTHHDSVSGSCVLRMDHHCIWIANCVGLLNYKAFLLFVLYTMLACMLATCMLLADIIRFFQGLETLDRPSRWVGASFRVPHIRLSAPQQFHLWKCTTGSASDLLHSTG